MCTNFSIKTTSGSPIIGRSMELGPNLNSKLYFRPKGFEFDQRVPASFFETLSNKSNGEFVVLSGMESIQNIYSWTGEYGFMAMNAFGEMIAGDGMNTEGLVTGCMVLTASVYQEIPKDENGNYDGENAVFYPNLSNWILSNCADCNDVINKLDVSELVLSENSFLKNTAPKEGRIRVINPFEKVPNAMKFHFPVHDAKGNNIVLEYTDGKLTITDLSPVNVLTNDPLISWQQTNVINNYVGISPCNTQNDKGYSDASIVKNYFDCHTFAQGTGFVGLPGSSTPVDRFVRAAMMTNFAFPQKSEEEAINLGFHILNTVDIPLGTSRDYGNGNVHDFTQWVTMSDLKNKIYHVRMYGSPQVFKVEMDKLNLDDLSEVVYEFPVMNNQAIDVSSNITLKELSSKTVEN
ncbi:linear amide C-N hydrolase [Aureivirga sp. CE67]|uniref:linear amide C-N hydrolase n=1 Tax=Aureivirga sp. CE67 TaxID=1788983 RepID=UPI0018CADC7A|nr:linear amide C-N hydrolase [Aureivirga sp. CE67]